MSGVATSKVSSPMGASSVSIAQKRFSWCMSGRSTKQLAWQQVLRTTWSSGESTWKKKKKGRSRTQTEETSTQTGTLRSPWSCRRTATFLRIIRRRPRRPLRLSAPGSGKSSSERAHCPTSSLQMTDTMTVIQKQRQVTKTVCKQISIKVLVASLLLILRRMHSNLREM